MLTDEQKDAIGMALVPLYQQLERDVIADCARRLQKTGRLTETAEIMADALRAKGYSPAQIRREVMRAINADLSLQREIAENTRAHKQAVREAVKRLNAEAEAQSEHLWEKAGGMAFRGDLSAWQGGAKPVRDSAFSDMIAAMKRAAAGELKNLTKSLGFRLMDGSLAGARSIYTAEMNRALVKLTSGAFSWRQCVRDACRELGRSGLRTVDYDSGAARSLDTAAFNALRTASSRLSAEITMHNVETTETALVEVSSHWGAREGEGHANHAGWQGKIYSVHGATDKYPNLEEATGYPSDPLGLCGYNCRHTFYPYWEGISEPADFPAEPAPVEVNGRAYTCYQATQEQRRREREIRAMKREANALEAAGEGGAAKELRSAVRGKVLEYRQFSDEVGIRAKVERLGVCEGVTDSKAVVKALKKAGVLQYASVGEYDRVIERLRKRRSDMLSRDDYDHEKSKELLDKIFALEDEKADFSQMYNFADGDLSITAKLMSDDVQQKSQGVEAILSRSEYGLRRSTWSGVTLEKPESAPEMKNAAGLFYPDSKDIWIRADYRNNLSTIVHEHLHARSIGYYNRSRGVTAIEEATVQYLTEEIIADKGMTPQKAYGNLVNAIRTIRTVIAPRQTDYEFARKLFDIPLERRYNELGRMYIDYKDRHPAMRQKVRDEVDKCFKELEGDVKDAQS